MAKDIQKDEITGTDTTGHEWDGIKARWSYHPDSGMRLTLVDAR